LTRRAALAVPEYGNADTKESADTIAERERLLLAMMSVYPAVSPPSDDEWREMVAHLRFALHRQQRGFSNIGLTVQQSAAAAFANTLAMLFLSMPGMKDEGLHQPLALLVTAFNDLAAGTVPDLFKPLLKPSGRHRAQQIDDIIKGKAARILELLIQGGAQRDEAATRISRTIKRSKVRGHTKVTPTTIIKWRERCNEGEGTMSAVTLAHFSGQLPPEAGAAPTEQAEYLIRELQSAGIIREA
jgi:hypothetical protein